MNHTSTKSTFLPFRILVCVLFLLSMSVFTGRRVLPECGEFSAPPLNENGTPDDKTDDYYELSTADHLFWFAEQVNSGKTTINGKMKNPIDLNPGFTFKEDGSYDGEGTARPWTPIGRDEDGKEFNGVFDGAGFTIRGIYVNAPNAECAGLFGDTETNSVLKNITIENSYLCGGFFVGGICGGLKGQIKNCTNKNCTIQGNYNVGGICGVLGWENAVIENCKNSGSVSGTGDVGGICGNVSSSNTAVKGCSNSRNISSSGDWAGGIFGYSGGDTTVSYCYNEGDVTGSTVYVGGIGGLSNSTVSFCYNTGSVSGNGESCSYVGGICGTSNYSNPSNCFYLTGCAKDGNDTYQNGIGTFTLGQSTVDTVYATTGMNSDQFASGEVAYLLNGSRSEGTPDSPLMWYQKLSEEGKDLGPVLIESHGTVYCKEYLKCDQSSFEPKEYRYTNDSSETFFAPHPGYSEEGFCTLCGKGYEPIELSTSFEDVNNDGIKDDVYLISNAGQLF